MTALNGAVVGFGNIAARGHWPALAAAAAVRIVAVVDAAPERRAAAAALAPGLRCYATLAELAREQSLDFVDICTPPDSHVALAAESLARGWHVLCEKPLTLDPAAFERLARAAREAGRVLYTVHNWKVAPIFTAALQVLRAGTLGAVRHVDHVVWRNQPCKGVGSGATAGACAAEDWRRDPAQAGGGILVDHGWHAFYLIMSLVGELPQRISAQLTRPDALPGELEETVSAAIAFAGAEAGLHLTWRAATRRNTVFVLADRGALVIDDDRLVVLPRDGAPATTPFAAALSAGSHHEDWFADVLSGFLAEIRDPRLRGTNLREAGWCAALTAAAYRSGAQNGTPIALVPPRFGT